MDAYDVIEQHWPYDGPHSDDTVTDALVAAGRLVRYANNATQRGTQYAATVDRCVGALHGMVAGLEQLTLQLASTLERHADDPNLYDDRYSEEYPAREVALNAARWVRGTRESIVDLTSALNDARRVTTHLGQH